MDCTTYNEISAVASIFQVILMVISACIAFSAIRKARSVTMSQNAVILWDKYLSLAIQHPKLAYPVRFKSSFDYNEKKVDGCELEYERYEWLFSVLIETASEILNHLKDSHKVELIRLNLEYHSDYIKEIWTKQKGTYFQYINPMVLDMLSKIAVS